MAPIPPHTQLALDLLTEAAPSLRTFVPGRNAECLQVLSALAQGERRHRFVYLWGQLGSGRSHLLNALAGARHLHPGSQETEFAFETSCPLYVADDVNEFSQTAQHRLFHLFNQVLAHPEAALVCAGNRPPLALQLREDLRSRLGLGLVFELHLLDDEDKTEVLRAFAEQRGVSLAPDVLPWLLAHRSREIRRLIAEFDSIDRYALMRKRPITLTLVRDWLSEQPDQTVFGMNPQD